MKKSLTIILTVLLTASILTGCAVQAAPPKQNDIPQESIEPAKAQPAAPISEPSSPTIPKDQSLAYKKLTAYKTENYSTRSVADFNAALVSDPDSLGELLAANAAVRLSPDDENYDFITTTMQHSLNELYCEHMGEQVAYFTVISKESRPYTDELGEIWYYFICSATLQLDYSIKMPELLTIAERDNTFLTFKEEMQNYLDGLSEAEITGGNFRAMLTEKIAEITDKLSTEKMRLSCGDIMIEIMDS